MKFKNLRQLEDKMLTEVLTQTPLTDINVASNVQFLVEDVAVILSEIHYELDSLRFKYNIEEKDLLHMLSVLSRGESIPARTVKRAYGDKV